MSKPILHIKPNDFSLKMFEAYLNKRDIEDVLSKDELRQFENIIYKMQSPYIFKFSMLIAIRRNREEQQNSYQYPTYYIPALFLTKQEHYNKREEDLQSMAHNPQVN